MMLRRLVIEMPVVISTMPAPANKAWTALETERLRDAWCNLNIRMRDIPGICGHTRNSCIGKAHRMKLPSRRIPRGAAIPSTRVRRTKAQLTGDISHNMPPAGGDWQLEDAKMVHDTGKAIPAPEATLAPYSGSLFLASIEAVPEAIATGPEAIATSPAKTPDPKPYAGRLFASAITEQVTEQVEKWSGPGVRYLDLRDDHCRAFIGHGPAGDDVDWQAPISCGKQKVNGNSYCVEHGRMFFNRAYILKRDRKG